jgi:hypothetical protein
MRGLFGLGLVVALGCGESSSDSEQSGRGGSGASGAAGVAGADGGAGRGGAGAAGGSATGGAGTGGAGTGGAGQAGAGMAGKAGTSSGGSAGQAGGPGCISPPWPGEECENGVWFCRPDARDFMVCDETLCATCEGFESPQEQDGCRCVCNAMRTGVSCERT